MFFNIGVLKNFAIFTGKHQCSVSIQFNFLKKRLQHWCFPVNIAKCLSTAFLKKDLRWLLLKTSYLEIVSHSICFNSIIICQFNHEMVILTSITNHCFTPFTIIGTKKEKNLVVQKHI